MFEKKADKSVIWSTVQVLVGYPFVSAQDANTRPLCSRNRIDKAMLLQQY